ncbi:MAG: TIGR04325 family methyltransferase [Cyanobacteria bacterium P01_A01_bin.83]
MIQSKRSPKRILRGIIEQIPLLSDLYADRWLFYKQGNAYRGVFQSFEEAIAAIPSRYKSSYDLSQLHKTPAANLEQIHSSRLNPRDYPVIFWLQSILEQNSVVVDFGGNTGSSYYSYRKYLDFGEDLRWIVCDVPAAVASGSQFAQQIGDRQISFTSDLSSIELPDIFLTCGTLQYVEPSLAELLNSSLASKPKHLIINRVPFYDGKEFITLQNIWQSIVPYKIQNRNEFIREISQLDYELIDSWSNTRTCSIPFHPECFVNGYHGFYFKRK